MTGWAFFALALAGGAGATLRALADSLAKARWSNSGPWPIAAVNLVGSFALGLLTGLAASVLLPESIAAIVGVGFLGGFTTLSAASVDTVELALQRKFTVAFAHVFGVLVASVALAFVGLALGRAFVG